MSSLVSRLSHSSLLISLAIIMITVFITPRIVLPLSHFLGLLFQAVSPVVLLSISIALIYLILNTTLKLITTSLIKMHCESFVVKIGLCKNCSNVKCTTLTIAGYTLILCALFIIILSWYILVINGMLNAVVGVFAGN